MGCRTRKRFECPHRGFVAHTDVNAAFHIARAPRRIASLNPSEETQKERARLLKKQMRRRA